MPPSEKFVVVFSPAQREALRGAAASLGLNDSALVRRAVGEYLAAHGFSFPDDLAARGDALKTLMESRTPFISVANTRAIVARSVPLGQGRGWKQQDATNWEQLEDEAAVAVSAQGGYITLSGVYTCPPELAARAEFED